jgi:hypothetical protein
MKTVIKIFSILKLAVVGSGILLVDMQFPITVHSDITNVVIAAMVIWFNNMYYSAQTYWVHQR